MGGIEEELEDEELEDEELEDDDDVLRAFLVDLVERALEIRLALDSGAIWTVLTKGPGVFNQLIGLIPELLRLRDELSELRATLAVSTAGNDPDDSNMKT